MSEQHPPSDWERALAERARRTPYPPTPDIAGKVRARLHPRRSPARRLAAVAALLLTFALLLAVPEVRAAVLQVLRLGAVTIIISETQTPTLAVSPTQPPILSSFTGETTLEDAQAQFGRPVLLPPSMGLPDKVYVQDFGGVVVTLAWLDTNDPHGVNLILQMLDSEIDAVKFDPASVRNTRVHGDHALWLSEPHMLGFYDGGRDMFSRQVYGNVLIWTIGETTYRIETQLTLDSAIELAESLR